MADLPNISQITLPNGTTYNIKDAKARADIENIQNAIAGGVTFIGETSTQLSDGSTTSTIVINGENVTAGKGNLVVSGNKEYVFDGTKWIEMGDLTALGDLAWKDSVTASYTPAGTVSQPTFTGSELTSTGSFTPSGGITNTVDSTSTNGTAIITAVTSTTNGSPLTTTGTQAQYVIGADFTGTSGSVSVTGTPAGTVSQPTFTGSELTSTGSFTPSGNIDLGTNTTITDGVKYIEAVSTSTNGYPLVTISTTDVTTNTHGYCIKADFTGSSDTVSVTGTPSGSVSISTGNGTANYTPAGSVSAPTISVATAGSTTTVNSITAVGTLPSLGATVTDEVLTLSWDAGTLPTKGANTTVKTGDASYSATAPTFTGTGAELVGSFTGTSLTSTGSFTPDGVVKFKRGQAVMNGSGQSAYWTISWQSALDCISLSSVLTAGTTKYFHPSFTGTSGSVSVTGTPEGTVSQPTFSGSELTSTGSFTSAGTIKFKAATSASAWGTAASYLKLGTVLTAGTSKYLHSAFTGTSGSVSVTGTPSGTVSQPTFSGTAASITST